MNSAVAVALMVPSALNFIEGILGGKQTEMQLKEVEERERRNMLQRQWELATQLEVAEKKAKKEKKERERRAEEERERRGKQDQDEYEQRERMIRAQMENELERNTLMNKELERRMEEQREVENKRRSEYEREREAQRERDEESREERKWEAQALREERERERRAKKERDELEEKERLIRAQMESELERNRLINKELERKMQAQQEMESNKWSEFEKERNREKEAQLEREEEARQEREWEAQLLRERIERESQERKESDNRRAKDFENLKTAIQQSLKLFLYMLYQQQQSSASPRRIQYGGYSDGSQYKQLLSSLDLADDAANKRIQSMFNGSLLMLQGTGGTKSGNGLPLLEQLPEGFEDQIFNSVMTEMHIDNSDASVSTPVNDGTEAKEQGNVYFKNQNFTKAIKCYSTSINQFPTAEAYGNRAMAYIKLNKFIEAEKDCTEALRIKWSYFKAYARRARARTELGGNLKGALDDVETALEMEPDNVEMKQLRVELKEVVGYQGNAPSGSLAIEM